MHMWYIILFPLLYVLLSVLGSSHQECIYLRNVRAQDGSILPQPPINHGPLVSSVGSQNDRDYCRGVCNTLSIFPSVCCAFQMLSLS